MDVKVLAGNRKADTYLFVAADKDVEELPQALLTLLYLQTTYNLLQAKVLTLL